MASISITSPFFKSAIGPPTDASGPTWPIQKPLVAPENLQSVIRATFSHFHCPYIAAVVDNISRIPGPPRGPSYLIIIISPSLYFLFLTAL